MATGDLDRLDVEVGLDGVEELGQDVNRAESILEKAAQNINKAFDSNSNAGKKFNEELLKIEKHALSLTRQYANLGKAGNAGFQEIEQRQTQAIARLTELQGKLRSLDVEAAKVGVKKSRLAEILKESKDVRRELDFLERDLIQLQQLDVVIKARVDTLRNPKSDLIDSRSIERDLIRQEKAAYNLEKQLTRLSRIDNKGSKDIVADSRAALTSLNTVTTKIAEIKSKINVTDDQNLLTSLRKEARLLDRELDRVSSDLNRIKLQELRTPSSVSGGRGGLSNIASGFGLTNLAALGAAGGVAAGIGAGIYSIKQGLHYADLAIDKASEATRANRVLASSAVEAGLAYQDLANKNAEFAEKAGLSKLAATSLTARITQLATRTNRPEDISRLQQGFLDLGAARGIDAKDLEIIIQQIITGQDEGYKKLLLPNPSQLYQEYARRNNRTVGSLTAIEKSQIFEEKFLEKADLFNGTAEARMQSIDGQAAKMRASFEDLGVSIATAFASSPDVAVTIDNITSSIKSLTSSLDDLYKQQKLGAPVTNEQIKEIAKPGILSGLKQILGAGALVGGKSVSIVGLFDSDIRGAGESVTDYGAGILTERTSELNEDIVRRRLNAQKLLDFKQEQNRKDAEERQKQDREDEEARRKSGVKEREYERAFKSSRTTLQALKEIRDSFTYDPVTEDYKGPLYADKNFQYYEKALRAVSNRVERQYRLILGDPKSTETILRQALVNIESNKDLTEEDQEKLIQDFQKGVIEAITRKYNKILSDPKLNADTLNKAIRDITSDKGLSEDKREDLLDKAENKLKEFSKKLQSVKNEFRELLVSGVEDNQLLKAMNDVNKVFDETKEKFTPLGEQFSTIAANMAKANAERKVAFLAYESTDKALKFRQEAFRLQEAPDIQFNAFERRLSEIDTRVKFVLSDSKLRRLEEENKFYAQSYQPGGKTYLEERFGYNELDRLTRDAQGRFRGESPQAYNQRLQKYLETSIQIKESFEELERLRTIDFRETGIYGQEARATALLDRLPSREELVQRLSSYGETREQARILLEERANAQSVLRAANQRRFDDFIANQRFLDLNRQDAEQRIRNLESSGRALTDREQLDQFLNIVNELGNSELTPQLRAAKIRTLNAKAEIEENQRKNNEAQMATITNVLKNIQIQLDAQGLKVDLGDTPIVEVTIDNNGQTSLNARPDRNAVRSGR